MPDTGILSDQLSRIIAQHRKRLADKRIDPEKLISPSRWKALNKAPAISGSYRALTETDDTHGTKTPNLDWTIKVDVDGWYPQDWISIEINSIFGFIACVIFKLNVMNMPSESTLRIEASRIHAFGNVDVATFDGLIFEAKRETSILFDSFVLTLVENGYFDRALTLKYEGAQFGKLDIEIDNLLVEPASEFRAPVTTSLNTKEHDGNLPALKKEVLTLPKMFGRAGLATKVSINAAPQTTDLAGEDKLWNDSELNNAMTCYWLHYAELPQWSLWSVFADTHEDGRSLLGVMFDHVGNFQRQGSAVFLDSYIANLPLDDHLAGIDPTPTARRRVFFTLIHEIGHALNLGHSFEKIDGTPWLAMANDPKALSFMNYPEYVSGDVKAFFAKFAWRFGDDELKFLRHAPRQFVKPGLDDWNENHGALALSVRGEGGLRLRIDSHHRRHNLEFMEPLWLDVSLSNHSDNALRVDRSCLELGGGLSLLVRRKGQQGRRFAPMMHHCLKPETEALNSGGTINHRHFISADSHGWRIDEPGLYEVQALTEVAGNIIYSNRLQIFVSSPNDRAQEALAASYFNNDVGRVIAFDGAPALSRANATLDELIDRLPQCAAARSAVIARHAPEFGRYKTIRFDGDSRRIQVNNARISEATKRRILQVFAHGPDGARSPLRLRSQRMNNQLEALLTGRAILSGAG